MTVWNKLYDESEARDSLAKTIRDLRDRLEHQSVAELQKAARERLASARKPDELFLQRSIERRKAQRMELETTLEPSFHPQILPSSRKLAANRSNLSIPIHERLYGRRLKNTNHICKDHTSTDSVGRVTNTGFERRQREYEDAREWRKDIRTRQRMSECTFHPKIGQRSEELAVQLHQTPDVIHRLAVSDLQKREVAALRRDMLAEPECKFVPEIDGFSDALASMRRSTDDRDVHERLSRPRAKSSSRSTVSVSVDLEHSTITPARRKSTSYSHVKSNYSLKNPDITLAVIETARRRKDAERKFVLQQREARELEECTFQPNVNKQPNSRSRPILVPGLGKFLDNQNRARRQSIKMRALREYDDSEHEGIITIPSPFSFSESA